MNIKTKLTAGLLLGSLSMGAIASDEVNNILGCKESIKYDHHEKMEYYCKLMDMGDHNYDHFTAIEKSKLMEMNLLKEIPECKITDLTDAFLDSKISTVKIGLTQKIPWDDVEDGQIKRLDLVNDLENQDFYNESIDDALKEIEHNKKMLIDLDKQYIEQYMLSHWDLIELVGKQSISCMDVPVDQIEACTNHYRNMGSRDLTAHVIEVYFKSFDLLEQYKNDSFKALGINPEICNFIEK